MYMHNNYVYVYILIIIYDFRGSLFHIFFVLGVFRTVRTIWYRQPRIFSYDTGFHFGEKPDPGNYNFLGVLAGGRSAAGGVL